ADALRSGGQGRGRTADLPLPGRQFNHPGLLLRIASIATSDHLVNHKGRLSERDTKIPTVPHNSGPAICSSETRQKGLVPHIIAGQRTVKMALDGGQGRGRTADLPLFREQSNHVLSRQDATRWADLGTYLA